MTQTNQTYIEEKKQEIEKAILEYLDDNGWKYGEDFYGWLIPSITQALQDAIKYGEEKALKKIESLYLEFDTDPKETLSIIAEHVDISLNAKGAHSIDVNGNCNHGCC